MIAIIIGNTVVGTARSHGAALAWVAANIAEHVSARFETIDMRVRIARALVGKTWQPRSTPRAPSFDLDIGVY